MASTTQPQAPTPLAPSVEKAYYRKCIELKRRLNELEEANDGARLRRSRLDRAVLKLRLERAFLLEQLGKRMEWVPEGEARLEEARRVEENRRVRDGVREREREEGRRVLGEDGGEGEEEDEEDDEEGEA